MGWALVSGDEAMEEDEDMLIDSEHDGEMDVDQIMTSLDADKDGFITLSEIMKPFEEEDDEEDGKHLDEEAKKETEEEKKIIEKVFLAADEDKNSKINKDELKEMLRLWEDEEGEL